MVKYCDLCLNRVFGLTFVMLLKGVIKETSDPVRGNGKWNSSRNFKGVYADHFSILK